MHHSSVKAHLNAARLALQVLGTGFVLCALAGFRNAVPEPLEDPSRTLMAEPLIVPVVHGEAEFDLPASVAGSGHLLVVSALASEPGPFPVTVRAIESSGDRPLIGSPLERLPSDRLELPPERRAPVARPPSAPHPIKRFAVLVRDGDPASAGNYLQVEGHLRAVGGGIQIYVDRNDVPLVTSAVLNDLVATFDERILPDSAREVGLALDVDGDGRFTVLLSSWLSRMAGGKVRIDGFVRGSDFNRTLSSPFSNACDMMYLNANLPSGPHLRTVAAHEYSHAVTYSQRLVGAGQGRHWGQEEEGWLDEAIAHLAEDRFGFSRTNLDFRVSAYLSRPERYRLVVEDYFASDLFRSHGNRGGTYLFLRWCVDQFGPGLIPRLVRSDLRGVANLEAATGQTFEHLFRRWSLALFLSGFQADRPGVEDYRTLELRHADDQWMLAGPRYAHLTPGGAPDQWDASGTTPHYCVIRGASDSATRVTVKAPREACLQVTLVPLPPSLACLDLAVRLSTDANGMPRARVEISERDGRAVRLSALGWEPLVPGSDPRSPGFRHDGLDMLGIAAAFGTSALPAGGTLGSRWIPLRGVESANGPLVFKVVGTDDLGRRVAAWAEVTSPGQGTHPDAVAD